MLFIYKITCQFHIRKLYGQKNFWFSKIFRFTCKYLLIIEVYSLFLKENFLKYFTYNSRIHINDMLSFLRNLIKFFLLVFYAS